MKLKQYLVFNAETTGLDPMCDQICHLAYIILDDKFNPLVANKFYFRVDEMSYGAMNIHGLPKENLEELSNGKGCKDYCTEIYEDFTIDDLIAYHNFELF